MSRYDKTDELFLEKVIIIEKVRIFQTHYVPDAATSATGLFWVCAIKPITEKITNPAKKLVEELTQQTINASLWNSEKSN